MITTWFATLASVVVVSVISLIGVLALSLNEQRLRKAIFVLVALAAGALFGDALVHLIPEIFAETDNPAAASGFIILGIILLLVLEKIFFWGHHHEVEPCVNCEHTHIQPVGKINLVADSLHNFIDGIAIGASYLVSLEVGLATTIAVVLHEIPQEIGDFGILLHAGFTKAKALWFNLLSALFAVIGAMTVLLVGPQLERLDQVLLPLAAGTFLYVAGADLVPEIHKTRDLKKSLLQLLAFVVGIGLMFLLLWVEF